MPRGPGGYRVFGGAHLRLANEDTILEMMITIKVATSKSVEDAMMGNEWQLKDGFLLKVFTVRR